MVQRVMMIAGEVSGDVHGAGVVRELKRRQPSIEIYGIGGEKMKHEGMALTYHVSELSFMGFMEVLRHLPLIRSVEKTLEQLLVLKRPDIVVYRLSRFQPAFCAKSKEIRREGCLLHQPAGLGVEEGASKKNEGHRGYDARRLSVRS